MQVLNKVSDFVGKYMAWIVVAIACVALVYPPSFLPLTTVKLGNQSLTNVLLGVIMFGMGLTLKADDFRLILRRPKDVLVGVLAQYTIMPLGAFALAKLFQLPPALAVGLVLLGCVPGGTASNVMTFLAKGDVPLSVTLTMCSTLLAPVVTPGLTYLLAGSWVEVDFVSMLLSIVYVVLIPIVAGVLLHTVLGDKTDKIKKVLVLVSVLSIVTIVGMCVAPNAERLITSGGWIILAVALHHVVGLVLGWLTARMLKLNETKTRALAIEVGLQNSGLGVGLAGQFADPMCALPSAVATVVHQIIGPVVANILSKRSLEGAEKAPKAVGTQKPAAAR